MDILFAWLFIISTIIVIVYLVKGLLFKRKSAFKKAGIAGLIMVSSLVLFSIVSPDPEEYLTEDDTSETERLAQEKEEQEARDQEEQEARDQEEQEARDQEDQEARDQEEQDARDQEEQDARDKEEQEAEDEGAFATRTNPVPLGESVAFTETHSSDDGTEYEARYEMKITDVVRGDEALTVLQAENEVNEPAPEGMEWAIITIEGTLLEWDKDAPYTVLHLFSVIDSSGSEVPQDESASLDGNLYLLVELSPGEQIRGRIAKYMPVGDPSLLELIDLSGGNGIYFSLTE